MSELYPNIDANDPEHVIPDDFKNEIVRKILLPYYKSNIEYHITTKTGWSRVSVIFMTVSTIMITASSVMSFASSSFPDNNLNFIAGSVGLVSLVFKELASYANTLEHVKTMTINDMLKSIGVQHEMVDTSKNTRKALEKNKPETMMAKEANATQQQQINEEKMMAMERHMYEILLSQEKMKLELELAKNRKPRGGDIESTGETIPDENIPDEEFGQEPEEV
jgi:hypothetical protein